MPYSVQPLLESFARHADPDEATAMAAYMRDQFPFYGLKAPLRRELLKRFTAEQGWPEPAEIGAVVRALWERPERECHYAALDIINRQLRRLGPEHVALLEALMTQKSWWDTVDTLISAAGRLFRRFPAAQATTLPRWREADNIWLRRAAILFQRHDREKTDVTLLFAIIRENAASSEFFIQKAIGWALREYSKVDARAVTDFVAATELAPLSKREALKWLARHRKE